MSLDWLLQVSLKVLQKPKCSARRMHDSEAVGSLIASVSLISCYFYTNKKGFLDIIPRKEILKVLCIWSQWNITSKMKSVDFFYCIQFMFEKCVYCIKKCTVENVFIGFFFFFSGIYFPDKLLWTVGYIGRN